MAARQQSSPDLLRIDPRGRVPALAVDDGVPTENPAILQYIARSFPESGWWPDALVDQARVGEWLAWIASTVHVAYAHVRRAERHAGSAAALDEIRAGGLRTCRDLWQAVDARLGTIGERYSVADACLLVFRTWGRGSVLRFDMARDDPHWTAHALRMADPADIPVRRAGAARCGLTGHRPASRA